MRIDELDKVPGELPEYTREEKFTKGVLVKVIATLKRKPIRFSKIVKEFDEIKNQIDSLTKQRAALTDEIKDYVTGLFKAEEAVLSRVVQLADFTVSVSGEYMSQDSTKIDYEAIVTEIENVLTPELKSMMEEIKKKHTMINKGAKVVSRLTVTPVKESILKESKLSDMRDWIADVARSVKDKIFGRLNKFDLKLKNLKLMTK